MTRPSSTPSSSPSPPRTIKRFLLVGPALVVFALLGMVLFRARPEASLGRPAPDFTLPDVRAPERTLSLGSLRGRPVVVNFWASWCEPCRDEAPELAAVARDTEGRVAFLGVNILDGLDEARAYLREFGLSYPSARDATGRVSKLYRVTGIPETVFIDARGNTVGKYIGAFTKGRLAAIVRELVELAPGETLDITSSGETRPVP